MARKQLQECDGCNNRAELYWDEDHDGAFCDDCITRFAQQTTTQRVLTITDSPALGMFDGVQYANLPAKLGRTILAAL